MEMLSKEATPTGGLITIPTVMSTRASLTNPLEADMVVPFAMVLATLMLYVPTPPVPVPNDGYKLSR